MAESTLVPICDDPDVLERIYSHFAYLRGYPLRLRGDFSDAAVNLGVLADEDFLGFLMAYQEEREEAEQKRFAFLTADENLAISRYRHIRPVEPWPMPTLRWRSGQAVDIAWSAQLGEGRVLGTSHVDVALKSRGQIQLWWGGEIGVIWEAFFEERVRERSNHELLMHQLWDSLERYLAAQGAKQVFTYDYDPALDEAWYRAFLADRGYRCDPERYALPGGRTGLKKELCSGSGQAFGSREGS